MEVILIDDVYQLGRRGQVVKVAGGYGRNFLIPKKLAIAATPGNRKMFEQQRQAMARKEMRYREESEMVARELEESHVILSRKAGETGNLFGSVTSKDLSTLLASHGLQIDKRKILLGHPIKSIGNYSVAIELQNGVRAHLLVSVVIESGEAVARFKKKDEESEGIVAALEAKIRDMRRMLGGGRLAEEIASRAQERGPSTRSEVPAEAAAQPQGKETPAVEEPREAESAATETPESTETS